MRKHKWMALLPLLCLMTPFLMATSSIETNNPRHKQEMRQPQMHAPNIHELQANTESPAPATKTTTIQDHPTPEITPPTIQKAKQKAPNRPRNERTSATLGILAFAFGLLSTLLILPFLTFAFTAAIGGGIFTGLAIILGCSEFLLAVAAIVLGILGTAEGRKAQVLAIIGIVFAAIGLIPAMMFAFLLAI
jgi:hypothetical protein